MLATQLSEFVHHSLALLIPPPLQAAYMFYTVPGATPLPQLMNDALILAHATGGVGCLVLWGGFGVRTLLPMWPAAGCYCRMQHSRACAFDTPPRLLLWFCPSRP